MYEEVEEDNMEDACRCLLGYPVPCPLVPPDAFDALDAPDRRSFLDGICRTCPTRLDSERCHRSFAV